MFIPGHFLVASPHLPDPNFYRTVVLMLRHDEEGAFGVVLTRPLPNTVSEIWKSLGDGQVQNEMPIFLGGPVSGPLLALHCEPELAEGEVLPELYYATLKDHLNQLVLEDRQPYRIFSGYSGWGDGQLENEFEEGSWLSTPARKGDVFGPADELWKTVAGRIGWEILMPGVRQPHLPPSADAN